MSYVLLGVENQTDVHYANKIIKEKPVENIYRDF